jgi:hypothetical protein
VSRDQHIVRCESEAIISEGDDQNPVGKDYCVRTLESDKEDSEIQKGMAQWQGVPSSRRLKESRVVAIVVDPSANDYHNRK